MNEILNNEEIDTLLAMFRAEGTDDAVAETAAALAAEPPAERVATVDLLKPNRLAREQLRLLERCFAGASRLLSSTLSEQLRLETRCDCVAVEQVRFRSWIEQLPAPVAIYVVDMQPFAQPALFTASTSLLYGAVDRILGGSGRVTKVPKEFTPAEYTVADALVAPCLLRIVESLAEIVPLKWTIRNRFCNPSLAQVLPAQDVVLSVYFQVAGESLIGDLRLLLPFAALEPHLDRLDHGAAAQLQPGALRDAVARALRQVPLDLAVELGGARIHLRQLLELQAGDVVTLDTRIGAPAVIPVQGRPKFRGHVGRMGNRFAFRIADVVVD